RADGEPRLLETTVGRVVLLLPVAPARSSGELEASVDKLFGEGGGGEQVEQGDSAGGGQGVDIQPVISAADTIVEDVSPLQPMCQKKRKTVAVDASGPSHPPKKSREDYEDLSGPSVAGKPRSAVQRLLAGAVLNAEVRGEPIPTLPFVTSSVSATPERENENLADFMTGPNSEPSCSAKSSTPIIATATVDAAATAKETPVKPSLFSDGSSSAGGTDPTPGGFSDVSGSDFLIGESLRDEVESLKERNITTLEKEKSVLDVRVSDLAATVKVREQEAADSDAMVTAVKLQNDKLADQVHALEVTCSGLRDQILTYERLKEQFEEFQDVQMRMVGDKLAKLEVDLSEMTLHFEEKFYPHLLTTIAGQRWLLTHGLNIACIL
ncbi:hypothetical protein Tco_1425701, partial [Tanacetum coccineum]